MNQTQDIQDFVRREVVYCVSSLVSTLTGTAAESGALSDGTHYEELLNVCVQDDWETPVDWHIYHAMDKASLVVAVGQYCDIDEEEAERYDENKLQEVLFESLQEDSDVLRQFAEENNLDPEQREAYEHWIVTDWFAKRLEEKGEMVAYDICGLTIWGRCTTGQAIYMDSVIQDIYTDLHSKD